MRHSYFPSMAWRSLCLVSIFRHSTCSCSSLSLGNSSGCSRRCRAFRMRWAMLSWPRLVATSKIHYECFIIPIGWVFNWISWSPSAIWPRILTASKSRVLGAAWSNNWKEIILFLVKTKKEEFGASTLYLYDMFVAKIARFHQSCPSVLSSPLEVIGSREILWNKR